VVEPLPASEKSPGDWLDHDASVRIVPATKLPPEVPVDTDSFVAEVEQLRSMSASTLEPGPASAEGEWLDVLDDDQEGAVDDSRRGEPATVEVATEEEVGAPEPEIQQAPAAQDAAVPSDAGSTPAEEGLVDEGSPSEAVVDTEALDTLEVAQDPEPEVEGASGELDSLFATLRQPAKEPESDSLVQDETTPRVAPPSDPAPAPEVEVQAVESAAVVDPFDLKERMLLPIENRALRSVKRRIVELQNRVLEELRLGDDEWLPDRALFAASIGDEVALLAQESYVAGYAAAAELVGEAATPPPDHAADQEATADFVDAILAAVKEALHRARASGGGTRQVSAAVSRIFRAWRTDEAERRLRRLGARVYHSGILDALTGLGVAGVAAVAEGNPCGSCPAGTGRVWSPADELPTGTSLPPAIPACTATIVPVAPPDSSSPRRP
jgi:hypothetical protein